MDMFQDSEKPEISDDINSKLSELNNNFWKDEKFYNYLKSWLNSYDSDGQFSKLNKPSVSESFSTLDVAPAIILKKRNERAFTKFYGEIINDMEDKKDLSPCLINLFSDDSNKHETPKPEKNYLEGCLKHQSVMEKYYLGIGKIKGLFC